MCFVAVYFKVLPLLHIFFDLTINELYIRFVRSPPHRHENSFEEGKHDIESVLFPSDQSSAVIFRDRYAGLFAQTLAKPMPDSNIVAEEMLRCVEY